MDKRRTLYRLRDYKTAMSIFIFVGLISVLSYGFLAVYEDSIKNMQKERAVLVLESKYQDNLNYAIEVCNKAFSLFEKGVLIAFLFSILGYIKVFFFLRLGEPNRINYISLYLLGFGSLFIFLYYAMVGITLPEIANFREATEKYSMVQNSGIIMIVGAYLLFTYRTVRVIILERE